MSDATQPQQQGQITEPLAVEPLAAAPQISKPPIVVRRAYASDLSDAQWALVFEQLPPGPPGMGMPNWVTNL